jgi:F-type H+-transporting ATPase subunit b
MTLTFALVLFILRRFAWKPILKLLKEREDEIDEALNAANKAREEMANLQADNEKLLKQAKEERDAILNEARKVRDKMIDEARDKANEEAQRIVENAKERIENEKMAALVDLKNQVAQLSIDIAEKILRTELADKNKHEELIRKLIKEINDN